MIYIAGHNIMLLVITNKSWIVKIVYLRTNFVLHDCFMFIQGGRKNPQVEMLGISHVGVMLIKRDIDPMRDQLNIIEAFL